MARLTAKAIAAIVPILEKDAEARKAIGLWLAGQSDVEATGPIVRREVARLIDDRFSSLTRSDREQLLYFKISYPPGWHTSKEELPLRERMQFRTSTELKALILKIAELNDMEYGEWLRRVITPAAEREAKEHGIPGLEDTAMGG